MERSIAQTIAAKTRMVSKQDSIVSRGFYYTMVRVDPTNENRIFAVTSTFVTSVDGGKTFLFNHKP